MSHGPATPLTAPAVPSRDGWPDLPDYPVLGEWGRGPSGVVLQSWDRSANRSLAVKWLQAGPFLTPSHYERWRNDAAALAGQPHLLPAREVGAAQGQPYFVREAVVGTSLANHLVGTPWPAAAAAELVETLARAVANAHRLGVVHGDLKPTNVLFAAERGAVASALPS